MTIKMVAAYHEAGHAVLTYRSKYHSLEKTISLNDYGSGEIFVSIEPSKLKGAGLPSPVKSQNNVMVTRDLALILVAGYVAEQIAAKLDNNIKPHLDCAKPDHDFLRMKLAAAGLSKRFDKFEREAAVLLNKEWHLVRGLAEFLFQNVTADAGTVFAELDRLSKT